MSMVCLRSLRYDIMVVSQDGSVQTRFVAEEYFDGKLFLQYDSEKGRAEPQGPWAEAQLGAETWDLETMGFTDIRMELRMTLFDIMKLQDQKRGLDSLQETLGCEIQEDDGPGGFWNYCYGKEHFLCCHPETKRWTVPLSSVQTLALEMRKTWDVDRDKHKYYGHHVEGDICKRLRSYLDLGRDFMGRTENHTDPASGWGTPEQGLPGVWECPVQWKWDLRDLGVHKFSSRGGAEVQLPCGRQREEHDTPCEPWKKETPDEESPVSPVLMRKPRKKLTIQVHWLAPEPPA
ncbi:MHC class I polypeptide-related sequence B-like isoform X4 [Loxodonta africana]|uniref:MHC class I polypeptide-related sequence B-like isoform X4 n=1 Tax=Loxodonta africana TaxID=9785 RepID=UPI0030D3FD6F